MKVSTEDHPIQNKGAILDDTALTHIIKVLKMKDGKRVKSWQCGICEHFLVK